MERPWFASYPAGVPHEINPAEFTSIPDVMKQTVAKYADRDAFINMGKAITYQELDQLSTAFAAYLQQTLRLSRGARVGIMMPNLLQYPVALFGILKAGMVVVNINPLYTPRELEHQLKDSGAEAIVIVANFAHTLDKCISKTAVKHVIVSEIGDMLAFPSACWSTPLSNM